MLAEVPDFSDESIFLRIFRQMKKIIEKIKEVTQMNIFETVKVAVTVRQAAEHYGLKVNRNGMACCPFHDDKHPSMKLNEDYFYCFGCEATGDVIDFVARLLGLSVYEAAQRLAADFGLDTSRPSVVAQVKKYRPRVNQLKQDELLCTNVLSGYLHLLEDWKERYAPEAPEDKPDERFVEACHKLDYVEYLNDLLLMSDYEERADTVNELLTDGTIAKMQARLDKQKKEVRCHVREQEIA